MRLEPIYNNSTDTIINDYIVYMEENDLPEFINIESLDLPHFIGKIQHQQKEIERLNKCYCNRSDCAGRLNQKNEVYDSVVQRNEKAIEYIEQHTDKLKTILIPRIDFSYKDLLDILKGEDKK